MSEYFSWTRALRAFPKVLDGLGVTFVIVILALALAVALGMALALVRVHRVPVLNQIAIVLISFIRGTPEIIMLFIVYYGVPLAAANLFGLDLSSADALYLGIIAFGINYSGFMAELFRGGLEAVPRGQVEAAASINLTGWQTFRRVVLPQAVRLIIPGFGVMAVSMFQNTALIAALGVLDVMGRAAAMGVATNHYLEPYLDAAVIFAVLGVALDYGFKALGARASRGMGGVAIGAGPRAGSKAVVA